MLVFLAICGRCGEESHAIILYHQTIILPLNYRAKYTCACMTCQATLGILGIYKLVRMQCLATRMVSGFRLVPYDDRLTRLKLFAL